MLFTTCLCLLRFPLICFIKFFVGVGRSFLLTLPLYLTWSSWIPFIKGLSFHFLRPSSSLMGYYYCKPRACDARTPNVVLILAVALILLAIPKLFSSGPEEEDEPESSSSPFVVPILVILILLVVSWLGSPRRKVYVKPPYCRCTHACYCY